MMKKALYVVIGCTLIAVAYNLFFLPYDLVSTGIFGLGALLSYEFNYAPALFILLMNGSMIILSLWLLGHQKTKEYVIPGILIPVIIFFTYNITDYITLDYLEPILATIVGATLTGVGYSLLYKEGQTVGGIDIIQDIIHSTKVYRSKTFTYFIEASILLLAALIINIESALYSAIAIVIIRYMATKSKTGMSTSKTFFIITTKEEEVKNYIINELEHDLTEFNVKGGFSNNKSKILMTAIDTKEYYRLKEGLDNIDPKAFISIIDSYEVINKNMTLNKNHAKSLEKK